MASGRYFAPLISKGFIPTMSFLYRKVRYRGKDKSGSQVFPISIYFDEEEIVFKLHAFQNELDADCGNSHNRVSSGQNPAYYFTEEIFCLPFTTSQDSLLTEVLIKMGSHSSIEELKDLTILPTCSQSTFSKQSLVNPDYESCDWPWKSYPLSYPAQEHYLTYQELLLDFLFDLYESEVFSTLENYHIICSRLRENPYMNAIITKAKYLCAKEWEKTVNTERWNKALLSVKGSYHLSKLIDSRIKWRDLLISPNSHQWITPEFIWFDDIETEFGKLENSPKEFWGKSGREGNKWLLQRNDFWTFIQYNVRGLFNQLSIGILTLLYLILLISLLYIFIKPPTDEFSITLPSGLRALFILTSFVVAFPLSILMERVIFAGLSIVSQVGNWLFSLTKNVKPFEPIRKKSLAFYQKIFWGINPDKEFLVRSGKTPYYRLRHLPQSIIRLTPLLRPKLLISSFLIWSYISTNDRFWNLDFQLGAFEIGLLCLLLILSILFLVDRYRQWVSHRVGFIRIGRIGLRTLSVLVLSLVYSFLIGLTLLSSSVETMVAKDGKLQKYVANKSGDVFDLDSLLHSPDSVLYRSITEDRLDSLLNRDGSKEIKKNLEKKLLNVVLPRTYRDTLQKENILIRREFFPKYPTYKVILYILPDMLLFYTFIAMGIGIIWELTTDKMGRKES